ncbi:hypothetical protein H5410_024127 [Solanum commersonii]|uniref:Uncharacterized protein n=1 Tax=Solanum commersonii TaxID=4109 RepID=A0A9J5ZL50_SOLCO|nr:hypothetical protein H5410_024127 [Solanum commersonii]
MSQRYDDKNTCINLFFSKSRVKRLRAKKLVDQIASKV